MVHSKVYGLFLGLSPEIPTVVGILFANEKIAKSSGTEDILLLESDGKYSVSVAAQKGWLAACGYIIF